MIIFFADYMLFDLGVINSIAYSYIRRKKRLAFTGIFFGQFHGTTYFRNKTFTFHQYDVLMM